MPELIPCRVCEQEMASSAKQCPHCGHPNPNHQEPLNHLGCVDLTPKLVLLVSRDHSCKFDKPIISTRLYEIKNLHLEVRSGLVVRTDPSPLTCPLSQSHYR